MLPSIFEKTLFSGKVPLHPSRFIRPIHPKTEIRPTSAAIQKVLDSGWVGQLKIHGHRAQIHISSNPEEEILTFNRQGQLHRKILSPQMQSELRRLLSPEKDWNVIDAEWIKPDEKLYLFDFLKKEGHSLRSLAFQERWKKLPRAYISPVIQTLPVLHTLEQCLEALARPELFIEGLVFKSPSPGFEDTSIIRCRK